VSVLEQAGAGTISFNPITGPNLTKALAAIAEAEGYSLDADMATGIVAGAGGDLRNAIQNLQLMLQGPGAAKLKAGAKGKKGKVGWATGVSVFGGLGEVEEGLQGWRAEKPGIQT
jgi:hypothetical protein